MIPKPHIAARQTGVTLIELLIAIGIGAFLMLGLTTTFQQSSNAQRALVKSNELIENGRYATSILYEDLRHAGYYGHFYDTGDPPTNVPDPCEISSLNRLQDSLAVPLQSYTSADLTTRAAIVSNPNTCHAALLTNANLAVGSDILVIRRADTAVFIGAPNTNEVYIQTNTRTANVMYGDSAATVPTNSPDNDTTANFLKYPSRVGDTTVAESRNFHVHVYFVAPCSFGSGANGVCTGADDDIPTLKRLELGSDGTNTVMNITPLVEGIEYMKLEYGIDTTPNTADPLTGLQGDGIPDTYVPDPTTAQRPMIVSIRVYLLARATDATTGYSDTKQYALPPLPGTTVPILTAATTDKYKRHVFTAEVRPMNLSGRREIPQ